MRLTNTTTIIFAIILLGGIAVYQFPNIFLAPLLSDDVDYAEIFLNPDSRLTQVEGDVILNETKAKIGDVVNAGDSITTGKSSSATITYFEDSVTRLEPGTSYKITEIGQNAENPLQVDIKGEISQGTAWNKVIRPLDPDSVFSVSSSTAIAAVRGSAFAISVDQLGETTAYSSEHGLSLQIIDPETQQVVTALPVAEDEQASISLETGSQLSELQAKIKADPKLVQNSAEELRSTILQLTQKTTIQELTTDSSWYRDQQSADQQHLSAVEQRIAGNKAAAIKLTPDSPLYFIQKHADKKKLSKIKDATTRQAAAVQQLKRELIAQDLAATPPVERQQTLRAIQQNKQAIQASDFALLEKGYSDSLPGDRDYLLRTELLDIRVDIQTDPAQKEAFRQRALRVRELDLQDAEQLASCGPALLHDIERENEYLASLWGAEREYDASGQPIIKDMPELTGNLIFKGGSRLRPGDSSEGFHYKFNDLGDYPGLTVKDSLKFLIKRMDVYRQEPLLNDGQQSAWAVLDPDSNPEIMQKIIDYYADPDRLKRKGTEKAKIYTEQEVRALYANNIVLGAIKLSPGEVFSSISIAGTDIIGTADFDYPNVTSQPIECLQ